MTWTVLQSAGPDLDDYMDAGPGGFLKESIADLTAAVGGPEMFGLLIGGAILYVSWEASPDRSLALPSGLTVLLGGVLVRALPGNYQGLALSIVIVGLAAGIVAVGKRYVLSGGPMR